MAAEMKGELGLQDGAFWGLFASPVKGFLGRRGDRCHSSLNRQYHRWKWLDLAFNGISQRIFNLRNIPPEVASWNDT